MRYLRGGEAMRSGRVYTVRVLFFCVVYDTALCMAWIHAGPTQGGSVVCVAARPSQRGATRVLRSFRGSRAGHAALAASPVHSIRKRCGPKSRVVGLRGNLRRVTQLVGPRVIRPSRSRGSIPSGSDVAQSLKLRRV